MGSQLCSSTSKAKAQLRTTTQAKAQLWPQTSTAKLQASACQAQLRSPSEAPKAASSSLWSSKAFLPATRFSTGKATKASKTELQSGPSEKAKLQQGPSQETNLPKAQAH